MRDDGLRTRSKIGFTYKLEPSKVKKKKKKKKNYFKLKEIDEFSEKLDVEIKEIEQVMKQNQKVLFLLREPFSTTLQHLPQNYKVNPKCQTYDEGLFRHNSEELETNDDNDEGGKISAFEEMMKVKIELLAKKIGGFRIFCFTKNKLFYF